MRFKYGFDVHELSVIDFSWRRDEFCTPAALHGACGHTSGDYLTVALYAESICAWSKTQERFEAA